MAASKHLWQPANDASYIRKTVGIQALFDVLRVLGRGDQTNQFDAVFHKNATVDFSNPLYQASGKGRVRIKNTLLLFGGLVSPTQLPEGDQAGYAEIQRLYAA
jgi:hypothetical protein